MNLEAERMTAELADEIASSARRLTDPRTLPVRFSHLRAMSQSPAHCLAAFQEPDWKQTLSMRIGTGVHALLFEDKDVVVYPGKVRNGKQWEAFQTEHIDSVILSRKEHTRALAIASSIRNHHEASLLLFDPSAVREDTLHWSQLGRARRSTPDVRGKHFVCELKTTRCSHPGRFGRDALYRAYHAQLADQVEAVEAATGRRPEKAYIVAVETVPPYAVTCFELTARALERGAQLCRGWLERLLVCEASDSWPAYCEAIELLDTPDDEEVELVFADSDAEDEP